LGRFGSLNSEPDGKEIPDPELKFTPMDDMGELHLLFNQEMFAPPSIKQVTYRDIFRVSITAVADGSVVVGQFSDFDKFAPAVVETVEEEDEERRRLRSIRSAELSLAEQNLDFQPKITLHNGTQISMKVTFKNP
jgi:hypothetical protein